MPCYSRIESTVELGQNTDPVLLAKAMQALGFTVERLSGKWFQFYNAATSGSFEQDRLRVFGPDLNTNEVKRAYSAEVVKAAAQRFGWQVKQTSPTQLQVTRRS